MKNMIGIANKAEAKWPDDYAGGQVAQNGSEAETSTQGHCDYGGEQVNQGLGKQRHWASRQGAIGIV